GPASAAAPTAIATSTPRSTSVRRDSACYPGERGKTCAWRMDDPAGRRGSSVTPRHPMKREPWQQTATVWNGQRDDESWIPTCVTPSLPLSEDLHQRECERGTDDE